MIYHRGTHSQDLGDSVQIHWFPNCKEYGLCLSN